jgi:membrane-bound ClpP family serine protease
MKEILAEIKNIRESQSDLKKLGLTLGIFLLLIAVILFLVGKSSYPVWGIIGLIFILSALLFPGVLKPFNKIWMSLAIILGWIMTRVILSILFYVALTSLRFIAMVFNKRFLNLKIDKSADTYWEKRENQKFDPSNYERQF